MVRINVLPSLAITLVLSLLSATAAVQHSQLDRAAEEAAYGHIGCRRRQNTQRRRHGSRYNLDAPQRGALQTRRAAKAQANPKANPRTGPFIIPSQVQAKSPAIVNVPVEPDTIPNRKPGCKKLMWFTAVGSMPDSPEIPRLYKTYLLAALMSALRVAPSLEPHLIYDGPGDSEVARWWKSMGGIVHYHHLSFFDNLEIASRNKTPQWLTVFPTFLRIDIPLILAKHKISPDVDPTHVLYTDGDVMFLKDIDSCSFPPTATIRMGAEHDKGLIANAGVLYMNVTAIAQHHAGMVKWGDANQWPEQRDQTMILEYFKGDKNGGLQLLEDRFNWKGYWGRNETAVILHFHGPKPLRCLECYILHSRNLDYCYEKHTPCFEYRVFWITIMQDEGKYFKELLSEFYYYVGLAASPTI